MSIATEHFAKLDAYVVSTPDSKSRRDKFMQHFDGLFKSITFVPPVTFDDMHERGKDFKMRLILTSQTIPNADRMHNYVFTDKDVEQLETRRKYNRTNDAGPHSYEAYAASESLSLTVKGILEYFLDSDSESVMVLEDDAEPRMKVLDAVDCIPTCDVLGWGAFYSGIEKDTKALKSNMQPHWNKLHFRNRFWFANAVEWTRAGAEAYVQMHKDMPAVFNDISCKLLVSNYGMDIRSLEPVGIIQNSVSVINGNMVAMANA